MNAPRPRFPGVRGAYTERMSDPTSATAAPALEPAPTLRIESEALYDFAAATVLGAVLGLVISYAIPDLPLAGAPWSFGDIAALAAAVVAMLASGVGYWRSRHMPGQEWRLGLRPWKFTVNTISVVLVHGILALLATFAVYLVLSLAFIGLTMIPFWGAVLMGLTLGLNGYVAYRSASRMTTSRMATLLVTFILIGALTAMVTTTDPEWWMIHFSHLGTFDSVSSLLFNGTLIVGGLLVTTFAVYIANDMRALVERGVLHRANGPRIVSTLFAIMGVMLAGVGLVPVDVNMLIHNLSATGMAIMFLGLLIAGPGLMPGMPRAYFLASWGFLAALVTSIVLFATTYFGLTAFEIIVFALIFGWIAVFIRFLGVAGQAETA